MVSLSVNKKAKAWVDNVLLLFSGLGKLSRNQLYL